MKHHFKMPAFASAIVLATALASAPVHAAGGGIEIERQDWSFSGPLGLFDRAQLQRGFQVYKEVCSGCHSINRVRFRNLVEKGGPEFPEEAVKELAAGWDYQIDAGPNDDGELVDDDGEFFTRSPLLSDAIPGPYKNDKQAQAAQNGALPPDLSLITKARNTDYTGPVWFHPIHMLKDIVTAYQEGGPDYLYALLTGYSSQAPAYKRDNKGKLLPVKEDDVGSDTVERCATVTHEHDEGKKDVCTPMQEGMNYNAAFAGHQIAMAGPLSDEGVDYKEDASGKPVAPLTTDQYSRDVTAFLAWAADPSHDQRKRMGWMVMLYLLITTVLLYYAKKSIWKRLKKH